jgi:hypothetical protein
VEGDFNCQLPQRALAGAVVPESGAGEPVVFFRGAGLFCACSIGKAIASEAIAKSKLFLEKFGLAKGGSVITRGAPHLIVIMSL